MSDDEIYDDTGFDEDSWREYRAYLDAGAPRRKPISPDLHIQPKGVWRNKQGRIVFGRNYQRSYDAWRQQMRITRDSNDIRREFLRAFAKIKLSVRGSGRGNDLIPEDANKGATAADAERRLHEAIELPGLMEEGTRRRVRKRGPRENYHLELLDKSTKADIRFQATGLESDMDAADYHRRRLTAYEKRHKGDVLTGRGWFKGELLKLKTSMQHATRRILRTFGIKGWTRAHRERKYGRHDTIGIAMTPSKRKRRSFEL